MALASSQSISSQRAAVQLQRKQPVRSSAPPGLLRCLVVSWSDQRAEMLRQAAENESWQAIVCCDVGQFMRGVFKLEVPLTFVDLPAPGVGTYTDLREATERSREVSKSLLVVSVAKGNEADELWARQLGVWTHLPEATDPQGLEMVFREARKALAKQAIAYLDSRDTLEEISTN